MNDNDTCNSNNWTHKLFVVVFTFSLKWEIHNNLNYKNRESILRKILFLGFEPASAAVWRAVTIRLGYGVRSCSIFSF